MKTWVVDGVEYSTRACKDGVEVRRRASRLAIFPSIERFDAWWASVSRAPAHRPAEFSNEYLHGVARAAVCAYKEAEIEASLRRAYEPDEIAETVAQYERERGQKTRRAFASERGVPEGSLARWVARARREASCTTT